MNRTAAQPDPNDRKLFGMAMPPWRLRRLLIAAGVAVLFVTAAANGCEDDGDPAADPATQTEETTRGAPYRAPDTTPSEETEAPAETSDAPDTSEPETTEPAATEPATSEAETSESPEPPETTEEPSEESSEEPDAESFFAQFPSFDPVTASGTGDDVIELPASQGTITATHNGSANFVLTVLDGANAMAELPVNVIGSYEGTTAYGLDELSGEAVSLEIVADGDWEITIAPLANAAEFSESQAAQGDGVYLYTGGSATWAVSHTGESNFVVVYISESLFGWDLLVNEIGSYDGTVAVTSGPAVVVIIADGEWSLAPA